MRRSPSRITWLTALGWLFGLAALLPVLVSAQAYQLQVTLRDTGGVGIAGVSIIVRTEDGQELARQTTGVEGSVSFGDLPAVVLVAVEGQPRGGPNLYQLGADLARELFAALRSHDQRHPDERRAAAVT